VLQVGKGLDPYVAQGNVVLTADLPEPSSALDGTMLIEDAGNGTLNLIIYGHGLRIRINGGTVSVTNGTLTVSGSAVTVT